MDDDVKVYVCESRYFSERTFYDAVMVPVPEITSDTLEMFLRRAIANRRVQHKGHASDVKLISYQEYGPKGPTIVV